MNDGILAAVRSCALRWAIARMDYDAAHDIAAKVTIRMWRQMANRTEFLPDPAALESYVIAASRNAHIDRLRREAVRARREAAFERCVAVPGHPTEGPARDAATDELTEALDAALRKTPPIRRAAFLRVAEEGMTYAAVAAELGISARTVESHVVRTRKRLRVELADYCISGQTSSRRPVGERGVR